jgi:hypothetical protein
MPKLRELHGPAPGRQVGLKLHQLTAAEVHAELAQVFVHAQLAIPVIWGTEFHRRFRQKNKLVHLGKGNYKL